MKELQAIRSEAARLRQSGGRYALATVTKVEGPAYRRPGARMLVRPDGGTVGTVSGGCLEGEVARHALRTLDEGAPHVVTFDEGEDDRLGFGLGCGGRIHLLVEPDAPEDALVLLERCLSARQTGVLATVIEAEGTLAPALGRHRLVTADGACGPSLAPLPDAVEHEARTALARAERCIRRHHVPGGSAEVLYELVLPPVRLYLFGSGHDVAPVVRLADGLGWEVVVVGRRPAEELAGRFPGAACAFLMHPGEVARVAAFDDRSAAVVMNHHYARDRALVQALLAAGAPYVGVLGPRRRTERMLDGAAGVVPTDRLSAPVGLDLGAETPEEIALSIVAEIQAVLHRRSGGRLRDRPGAIHDPVPVVDDP